MMSAFDQLARPVQKWIRSRGWSELRDIQARSTNIILGSDKDLIVAASTAGGKTEAAFLPLISQVLGGETEARSGFDLVYIGPLKALINDQTKRLEDICKDVDLPIVPWHGDISTSIKSRAEKRPRGILLITPESLEALFIRKGASLPHLFGNAKAVVIDELHTFLDAERGVQLRSLLTRLELAISRPVRRIGLSATLGDINLARSYLRPDAPNDVETVIAEGGEAELLLQVRGYISSGDDNEGDAATTEIAKHLFENLRGSDNLIFAGSRGRVEEFADRLRSLCEQAHLPQEFYPHHASLSKDHREFVEARLKDDALPTSAVCTSTLELGIDIGDVKCVAQIGPPFTVAALRQRLGRSGRREGQPAILRQYAIEAALDASAHFSDRLRLGLVRSIAMIELLLKGWCEAPRPHALQLSTLVHQILSIIAERGGTSAKRLYVTLCERGPFSAVGPEIFLAVLRQLGRSDIALIEQGEGGFLLLGRVGEKLVEHYSFYAVFNTPDEYRIVHDGRELGTLPVSQVLAPKLTLIFSGRRWEILEIDDRDKVILVKPARAGKPPLFGGDAGNIDDRVIEKMREIFEQDDIPRYLDAVASELLVDARKSFRNFGFANRRIVELGESRTALALWCGSVKTTTFALALRAMGFKVEQYDGFIELDGRETDTTVAAALAQLADDGSPDLFPENSNLIFEKFHTYLSTELLQLDALSSRLHAKSLPELANSIAS
ncbi:MAG: DEAD/DEAH box helicase [Hyphomonas sp.]|uniref:DEAD/DEAH box helicase n=1 Tax=Hyphomonas sp. TaxID=87 RepID=UPI003266E701